MTAPRTTADISAAVEGPGRVPPGTARAAGKHLTITATCLAGCGDLDTGRTGDQPRNRRYATRWAEVDAASTSHVKSHRHPCVVRAVPAEVAR